MTDEVLDSRPKPMHEHKPDTRVECSNCKGTGRVRAIMCIPDNEEDGTNNCGVCRGLGFTGHYPGTLTKLPGEKAWREYADRLERHIAQLQATLDRLQEPDEAMIEAGVIEYFDSLGQAPEIHTKLIYIAMLSAAKGAVTEDKDNG